MTHAISYSRRAAVFPGQQDHYEKLINYYEEAGPDYQAWSRNFNMHFGDYRMGDNPFKRERMLEKMNREVINRLALNNNERHVLDLGCGLGATAAHAAGIHPELQVTGLTLVPWQVSRGNEIIRQRGYESQVRLIEADYTRIPFLSESVDGAYAIESMCHCSGEDKVAFTNEMHRVLKSGKRFVIVDGFLKRPPESFNSMLRSCYKGLCNNFALQGMAQLEPFVSRLERKGFTGITVEDISWNLAPSVFHVPFVTAKFLLQSLLKGEKLRQQNINNLKGVLLCMVMGVFRSSFGYYIISGRKG